MVSLTDDSPKVWIETYNRSHNRIMTPKEFVKKFNEGLADSKLEEYQNEGLISKGNEAVAETFRPEPQKPVSRYTIAVIKINGINYIRKRDIQTGKFVK